MQVSAMLSKQFPFFSFNVKCVMRFTFFCFKMMLMMDNSVF